MGVVWCGVVWCGVVWCGVVWCNLKLVSAFANHRTRLVSLGVNVVTAALTVALFDRI